MRPARPIDPDKHPSTSLIDDTCLGAEAPSRVLIRWPSTRLTPNAGRGPSARSGRRDSSWLSESKRRRPSPSGRQEHHRTLQSGSDDGEGMSDHDHDHDHDHEPIGRDADPAVAARARALEALLVEKGVLRREEIHRSVDWLVSRSPADGARLVARAWVDPEFKARLLADARAAAEELGLDAGPSPSVTAVENTNEVHHVVVCTLCSCYPRSLLGPPPAWYKSLAYRSRAVSDPRGVLTEFGLELDPDVELRVLDSTADIRYLVIPRRPAGTEGLGEGELASLVTRDSMIGVTEPAAPAAVPA
jgi:nitrile hydratase